MRETLATILWEGWTASCSARRRCSCPAARPLHIPPCSGPAGAGGCCACRLGVLGAGRAARPLPRNSCWKNKNPRIVPDTEVLFVSRSLDLS